MANWTKTLEQINHRAVPGSFCILLSSHFFIPPYQPLGVVVGNKTDLKHIAAVDSLQAAEFAREHGLMFVECSAKDNIDVSEPFEMIAKNTCKQFEERAETLKLL